MKLLFRALVSLAAAALFFAPPSPGFAEDWALKKDEQGIQVFTRPITGSELLEFRAETMVDAPLEDLSAVLEDIGAYPDWMANCKETRILKDLGGFSYRLLFIQSISWPIADRFVVLTARTDRELASGRITVTLAADKGEAPEGQEERVRMGDFQGKILLEYVERSKSRMTFQLSADPGGSLPPRAVNGGTLLIPFKTLQGMKKMVTKEKYRRAGEKSPIKAAMDKLACGGRP